MKKKILVLFVAIVFLFSQVNVTYAKGFKSGGFKSSSSRSFSSGSKKYSGSSSSKSSSKSSGYSGSSKSSSSSSKSSTTSSSSKSSSGYSGSSSSRSVPKSYSGSSSTSSKSSTGSSSDSSSSSKSSSGYSGGSSSSKSTAPSGGTASSKSSSGSKSVKSKTDTLKTSYMQDTYKKQASQSNYSDYKQKLNADQKKAYESSFNKSYNVNNRMNFEDAVRTRSSRINSFNTRPIRININSYHFGSPFSYGHAFVGPWDMWFLMRASDLFWYHHWHDIYPYRDMFQAAQFAQMEKRIKELEAQNNNVRDPNYLEPGVDPDLQFSDEYQQEHLDSIYYTDKYSKPVKKPGSTLAFIIIIIIIMIIVIKVISKPRRKKSFNSRIY